MKKETKKILVELTKDQDDTILRISEQYNITKSKLIRLWCDLLVGLENNVQVIVFDSKNIKILKNLSELLDTRENADTFLFNIELIYTKESGVDAKANISNELNFANGGNNDNASKNKELLHTI